MGYTHWKSYLHLFPLVKNIIITCYFLFDYVCTFLLKSMPIITIAYEFQFTTTDASYIRPDN